MKVGGHAFRKRGVCAVLVVASVLLAPRVATAQPEPSGPTHAAADDLMPRDPLAPPIVQAATTAKAEPPADRDDALGSEDEPAGPARPALEEAEPETMPDTPRRLDLGADVVWVSRPFEGSHDPPSRIRYRPTVGAGFHLGWDLFDFLRFRAFFEWALHGVTIPPGALTTSSAASISPKATIPDLSANTYCFGAQIAPVWHLDAHVRAWIGAGIGWGRFNFPEISVGPAAAPFVVPERAFVFWEVPLSIGVAIDVVPDWVSIEYQATAAPTFGLAGTALEAAQAVDAKGNIRDVGAFGSIQGSFVQTLGVALIL